MDTDVVQTVETDAAEGRSWTSTQVGGTVVCLFNGPYVEEGGMRQEVPEGSKHLLAFIALRRQRVGRRHAAETLWPDTEEERAAGNLRSALWRLRRAGIDVLVADKWSLGLRGRVLVDLDLMDQWATRMINGTETTADLTISRVGSCWWEVLPGWCDDWVLVERERLRQRMLHALEALSGKLLRASRFADAVEAAIIAVGVDPFRESAQRTLIEAHLAEGNQSEARRIWRDYRDLLRRELGVSPSGDPLTLPLRARTKFPE
jgi:DNA-binding SARP family transcriptional activator